METTSLRGDFGRRPGPARAAGRRARALSENGHPAGIQAHFGRPICRRIQSDASDLSEYRYRYLNTVARYRYRYGPAVSVHVRYRYRYRYYVDKDPLIVKRSFKIEEKIL